MPAKECKTASTAIAPRLENSTPTVSRWIPQGKLLHYVHMGFGSIYEKELHIKIEAGVVTKQRVIDNREGIR